MAPQNRLHRELQDDLCLLLPGVRCPQLWAGGGTDQALLFVHTKQWGWRLQSPLRGQSLPHSDKCHLVSAIRSPARPCSSSLGPVSQGPQAPLPSLPSALLTSCVMSEPVWNPAPLQGLPSAQGRAAVPALYQNTRLLIAASCGAGLPHPLPLTQPCSCRWSRSAL